MPSTFGGTKSTFGDQTASRRRSAPSYLASTSKVFRTGESTFGMLAAAMHRLPEEVVVHDATNPRCRAWGQMFAQNGTPAFCTPNRGLDVPRTCACAE